MMPTNAAMAYLKTLREYQGLTQEDIAEAAGVKSKQVYRWERGESEPPGGGLAAFIARVQGSAEEVMRLFLDASATEHDGKMLANRWLDRSAMAYINNEVDSMSDEEMQAALEIVRTMRQNNKLQEFIRLFRSSSS